MGSIINGPVEVVRVDELTDVAVAEIRDKKLLTDLLTDVKSGKISVPTLESVLIHNNLSDINGGGNWHLSEAQYNLIINNKTKRAGQEDIASANNIQVDASNQTFKILDSDNNLQLLDIEGTGDIDFESGELFCIMIPDGGTIEHLTAENGTEKPFNLKLQQDFENTTGKYVVLIFEAHADSGGAIFEFIETGAATLALNTPQDNYTAIKKQAACLIGTGDGTISGFESTYLDDKLIYPYENISFARDNGSLIFEAGKIYGVKIYDSTGVTLLHEFPCNENNFAKSIVADIVTGEIYFQSGFTDDTQDNYFSGHDYGFTTIEDVGLTEKIFVNYDNSKTAII